MRNMAVLHSPAFSYPLPVLVRVLFNLLIFKGKILYYNKYTEIPIYLYSCQLLIWMSFSSILQKALMKALAKRALVINGML